MKIRTQFWLTMILFGLLLVGIAVSVIVTNSKINAVSKEKETVYNIETQADDLNYLASSFLIYGEKTQIQRWQASYDVFFKDVNSLNVKGSEQQALLNRIKTNSQKLQEIFNSIVAANAVSASGFDPAYLQSSWSRISTQTQSLASDGLHLSQLLDAQSDHLRQTNLVTIVIMFAIFLIYFVLNFLLVQRRTLKSLAVLNNGTKIIGSGNLDYVLDIRHTDEVGELSQAFNRMTASLKEVTASRFELEKEINERKRIEEELKRVNRELRAISDCNQVMVRATDEQALLNDICQIMCDSAGYLMAWVGLVEHDEAKSIRPVAWSGNENGYIKDLAATWANTERGKGPTGMAVRTGKTHFSQDFATDPVAVPWREAALARGYRSSIAIPIVNTAGNVFAVFTLYSSQPSGFIPAEVKLLEELAGDLAFGIDVLRTREEHRRMEEALKNTAKEWQETFNSIPDLISIQDRNMRLVRVNQAYETITGVKQADLVGKKCHEVIHHTKAPPGICPHVQTMLTRKPVMEEVFEPRLGVYLEISTSPIVDERGEVVGTVHIAKDITERKKAEEILRQTRDYLDNLINYANAPIVVWDPHFRITRFNHAFERLTGMKADEAIGEQLEVLFPEESREHAMGHIMDAITGHRMEVEEIPIQHKDGSVRIVLWNSATLYTSDGRTPVATIAQGNDITERKQAEDELKQRTAELEDANKELESFTYSVSHDLREPLRTIDGFTRIMNEDYRSKLDTEGQKLLDTILSGTERMGQLITDLLSFSRISRQYMSTSVVDMNKLAMSVAEELKKGNSGRNINIMIGQLLPANGDTSMMRQVLANLISNAIKFTRPKEKTIIEIGCSVSDTENIYYVRDNGVGFDPQYADKLFNIFQRLHSDEQFEGTGVGLAIVYRIIQRHGGRVWAESEPDKGATFYFALPGEIKGDLTNEA